MAKTYRPFTVRELEIFFSNYFYKSLKAADVRTLRTHESSEIVRVTFEVEFQHSSDLPDVSKFFNTINKKIDTFFNPLYNGFKSVSTSNYKTFISLSGKSAISITISGEKDIQPETPKRKEVAPLSDLKARVKDLL